MSDDVRTTDVFKNGSTWIRADFHLHTRKDQEFKYPGDENYFVAEYVNRLKSAGIGIGVIANHNKFDMDEFKALRKNAKRENIGLLPGVELSVNDGENGIHTIIVFSDEWIANGTNYIQQFLTTAFHGKTPKEYEHENGRTEDSFLVTVKKLESFHKNFFLVMAHVEDQSGFWSAMGGGRIEELGKKEEFRRHVLAFQKVRTHDSPTGKPCRTKVQHWLKERYPAEVEGSDCKSLDEVGKGSPCYIKIGDFSFDAVKYSLKDFVNRVADKIPHYTHSHIKSISFEGGTLDGQTIHLSPELNTLIGIRGSGKSSIIEALRYVLGISFGEKALDTSYKSKLVSYTLGSGGKAIVRAVDKYGTEYTIQRILNEQADVYVDGVLQPGISVRETIINKPVYFGQKDLSSSGEGFEKDLVEKLIGNQLEPIRQSIEEQKRKLRDVIEALTNIKATEEKVKEYQDRKKNAEFQLAIFQRHGMEERLQKQLDFDSDMRICNQTSDIAAEFLKDLRDVVNRHEDLLKNQLHYKSKQNEVFFNEYFGIYNKFIAVFDQVAGNLRTGQIELDALKSKTMHFASIKESMKEEFARIERQLADELKAAGAETIKPEEYRQISKTLETTKMLLVNGEKQIAQAEKSKEIVLLELSKLNQLWHEEYKTIIAILDKVNANHSALQIKCGFKGNKESFKQYMQAVMRGSNIRESKLQTIADDYADFGAIYKELKKVSSDIGTTGPVFEKYFAENLKDFLTWQVPNSFIIEYHGKQLKDHSLGQRASALILFVLSQQDNDVFIIDQPEDDLDNQTIYQDVIKLVCELKHKTQFVFATHNANFPVLGDAEQVIACEFADNKEAVSVRSIDAADMQEKIIAIMEGGKEAFAKRKEIYELWTQRN